MTKSKEDILAELEDTEVAGEAELLTVSNLVALQLTREGEVSRLEAELKAAKADLLDISDRKLPEALKNARTKKFVTDDGKTVELKEELTISLPKKRNDEIIAKLVSWDFGDLVANTLTCDIEKGKDNLAGEIMEKANEIGLDMKRSQSVNAGSVKKVLKDRMKDCAEGKKDKDGKPLEAVDLGFFGAFEVTRAKITQ